jgi:uncharacterized protein (TIGR02145 family)
VNATGTITVSAACAAAAASSTPTLLVNTVLTNITHATTSATGIGTATGLPAGVTAAWASNTITISGTPTASGTFNYMIPLTGTSCSAVNATGTITVTTAAASACPSPTISYNGYNYNTVGIGTQCWMQENLRTRLYNDGTEISFNNSGGSEGTTFTWLLLGIGAYSIYANDSVTTPSSNLSNYGYLYNWYAAKGITNLFITTYKNICPTGWHVPTDAEWHTLISYLGGIGGASNLVGGKMKSTSSLWASPNTGANNSSGFTALPGGYRSDIGSFIGVGDVAFFWSATEQNYSTLGWYHILYSSNSNFRIFSNIIGINSSAGASVRCLRD